MTAEFMTLFAAIAGYNTIIVIAGTTLLGIGAGVIGTFSLLRRQSLISDAISHATLPGIAAGFLIALAITGDGRNIAILTIGAAATGALGIGAVQWITRRTRLTEDAAIGTVLSVFFGFGIVLMSHIQALPIGGQAGLNGFLLGSTATMTAAETAIIASASAGIILVTVAFMKEFGITAFDPEHAGSLGYPIARLDFLMTTLLLAIVAVGLRTVGLILIIALVIIPPVTARFWTDRLTLMVALSGFFGGLACGLGSTLSASLPDMPTGAVIVMTAGAGFALSFLLAPRRGVTGYLFRAWGFRNRVALRRGLIALSRGVTPDLPGQRQLRRHGLLDLSGNPTDSCQNAIFDVIRDQALWERYLVDYPDQATGTPEWGTRPIGDLLPGDLVRELEDRLTTTSAPAPR